ncbi:MAG: hypothetical protein ACI9EW_002032 [Cellvibrionaceae bacterium]|jgi:hypothetical protein
MNMILFMYLLNNLGKDTLRQAQGAYPELVEGYLPPFLRSYLFILSKLFEFLIGEQLY